MPFGPVSAFAGPVLLEPVPSPGFTMSMQPLHKLALHDVRQRDGVAPRDSHYKLVERLVVITLLEVLVVSLLLPCDSWPDRQALCNGQTDIMQIMQTKSHTGEMCSTLVDLALQVRLFLLYEFRKLGSVVT